MRFISPYRQYQLVAVHENVELLASGQPRVIAPGYVCEWTPFDVTDWERDAARRTFTYKGAVMDSSGRHLDPIDEEHRVSVFDTAKISDDKLRARVEKALLENSANGRDYVLVEQPKVEAPWPSYDNIVVHGQRKIEHVAAKIAEKVAEDGYDPAEVVAYERQNLNRPEVIEAVEALTASTPEPDDDLIVA